MSVFSGVPPYLLSQTGTYDAPFEFDVPASLELLPTSATATFDGTNASGSFLACLSFYSQSGQLLGRYFNPTSVAAGDTAEVSYTPPFGSAASNTEVIQGNYVTRYDETLAAAATGFDTTGTDLIGGNILEVWCFARGDGMYTDGTLLVNFNGDTNARYDYAWVRNFGGTVAALDGLADTAFDSQLPGASVQAHVFGTTRLTIPSYTRTDVFKTGEFTAGFADQTTVGINRAIAGAAVYRSLNAITSIQITCTPGKIDKGSRLLVVTR